MSHNALYKYISRLMAVLMALVLVIGAAPAARAEGESGTLGDNLSWSLSGGTLTITGKGAMADISETGRAPWHEVRNEIYQVVLPDGLTSVGDMAFYECSKLQSVVIPSSVTRIGKFAFAYCSDLKILNLGSGVTAIEECAFTDCYRLASLDLPGKLKTIGKKAFYRCDSHGDGSFFCNQSGNFCLWLLQLACQRGCAGKDLGDPLTAVLWMRSACYRTAAGQRSDHWLPCFSGLHGIEYCLL